MFFCQICQPVAIENVARILNSDLFSEGSILNAINGHPSITLTPNRELILKVLYSIPLSEV